VNGYDEFYPACVGETNIKADTASYFHDRWKIRRRHRCYGFGARRTAGRYLSFSGACFLESIGILSYVAAGGGTIELSGTSMSSPHVAGVVALMWQKELSAGRVS
jgi:hypothetical protein